MFPWKPGGDDREHLSFVPCGEAHAIAFDLDVAPVPVGAATEAVGLDIRARPAEQPPHDRIVRIRDQPVLWAEVLEQLTKHRLVGRRIRKDIRVVPIDVGEHCQLRREMQELGPRIEDGRGVLVALEDELSPGTPGRRRAEVTRDHPEPEPWVASGDAQDPGDQAGGGRLSRRAGHHDAKAIGCQLAPVFGLTDEPNVMPARGLGLRIAVAHLVALDDQVGLPPAHDIPSRMAVDPLDSRPGQDLRGGRIGILVRPGHVVTELFGHERQPGDRVAADAMSLATSSAA